MLPATIKMKTLIRYIILGLIFQSCDPTYSIRLVNKSDDTLNILATTTIHFQLRNHQIEILDEVEDREIVSFMVLPNQELDVGMAIAGLEDELPFTSLKINKDENTIEAKGEKEVLKLFQKKNGKLETPYQIVIE